MMRSTTVALASALLLAACSKGADHAAQNQVAAAPKKEKIPYCFFKDAETKGWLAAAGADGDVVVKGKVYRSDSRYKAVLEKPKVEGAVAEVWPTIVLNDTGFAAPENWWDVSFTIPGSSTVDTVRVRCGGKVFAELKVPRGG